MENNTTNDGGPVIGSSYPAVFRSDGTCSQMEHVGGLTIRDWFAGMALQGSVSCVDANVFTANGITFSEMAEDCYRIADAMIAARTGKDGKP